MSYAESLKIIQKAYGESTFSKTRTYEWYSAFKSGRDLVEDLPRSSRPSTSSTEVDVVKVKEMVTENRYLSLREIAAELSVSHKSIRIILNDCLGMKRVAPARGGIKRFLPRRTRTAKSAQDAGPRVQAPMRFFFTLPKTASSGQHGC